MRVEFSQVPEGASLRQQEDLGKLQKLSKEFEAFFMKEVVKAMRQTVPDDGLLNGGNAERIYQSMYDDKLAEGMAEGGDSGIAQVLYKQLSASYIATSGLRETAEPNANKNKEAAK